MDSLGDLNLLIPTTVRGVTCCLKFSGQLNSDRLISQLSKNTSSCWKRTRESVAMTMENKSLNFFQF